MYKKGVFEKKTGGVGFQYKKKRGGRGIRERRKKRGQGVKFPRGPPHIFNGKALSKKPGQNDI